MEGLRRMMEEFSRLPGTPEGIAVVDEHARKRGGGSNGYWNCWTFWIMPFVQKGSSGEKIQKKWNCEAGKNTEERHGFVIQRGPRASKEGHQYDTEVGKDGKPRLSCGIEWMCEFVLGHRKR